MSILDWSIVLGYLGGMIGLAVYLGRKQQNAEDYYVGGRNLPWWAVGISTMATQSGVISFVSIPAFVALTEGGGLTWMQYELAVPLALIFVMVVLIPFFRKLELVSVYEYLEHRFGTRTRLLISGMFLVSRGLATGVTVYTSALILQICMGIPLWIIILIVGSVTILYDTIGGMAGVVYSDVIQMGILFLGLILCMVYAFDIAGGVGPALEALPSERWQALDMSSGFGEGGTPFWAFLVGGFFLYASYYGTDQSQTQRELSAPTTKDTKRSLVVNGLGRFPLTAMYMLTGVAVGAAFLELPGLQAAVQQSYEETGKWDSLLPHFILRELPEGVRAIIIAGALAAAMSSLDSALNSLSASTVQDFLARGRELPGDESLRLGKITTVVWGIAITGFAFLVGGLADTVLEAINMIGSVFYGPILAAFVVGVLSHRANGKGVIAGVASGVGLNLLLWLATEMGWFHMHWMWWNAFGFGVTAAVALFGSSGEHAVADVHEYTLAGSGLLRGERAWIPTYLMLVGYVIMMIILGASTYAIAT